MNKNSDEFLLTLSRGLKALSHINIYGDASATVIGRELGISRTAAFRILETLAAERYLKKDPKTKTYSLASRVQRLSGGYDQEKWIVDIAAPMISELSREIGWPCMLSTPIGMDMMLRFVTDHESPLAVVRYSPGCSQPILHCDGGLVYLAFCSKSIRETIIEIGAKSEDPRNIFAKDPKSLAKRLDQIAEEQYCWMEFPQYMEGGFAVPVFDGRVFRAALGMRYMKNAMMPDQVLDRYLPAIKDVGSRIESEISEYWN